MANPTYQSILDGVKVLLNDLEGQRYPDERLVGLLNRALSALSTIRPDAFFGSFGKNSLNIPTIVLDAPERDGQVGVDEEMGIDRMFHPPLIEYVAGMAEAADDEFAVDGRAVILLERFRSTLLSV